MGARADYFLAAMRRAGKGDAAVDGDLLERVLAAAIEEGRESFPAVDPPSDEEYLTHLARSADDAAQIAALQHAELWLCCACALGGRAALTTFEAHYMPLAAAAVRAVSKDEHAVAEVLQQLRTRLFTFDGERRGAIADYAGRGPLSGWLRQSARRLALNLIRAGRREVSFDETGGQEQRDGRAPQDAELMLLKARFRRELQAAMTFAFQRLAPDQRALLRSYVVEGLTLEQIAAEHGVAASTVSRWLARVRDKLARDAKRRFAEATGLPTSECDSLIRVMTGSLHLSVGRLLRSEA